MAITHVHPRHQPTLPTAPALVYLVARSFTYFGVNKARFVLNGGRRTQTNFTAFLNKAFSGRVRACHAPQMLTVIRQGAQHKPQLAYIRCQVEMGDCLREFLTATGGYILLNRRPIVAALNCAPLFSKQAVPPTA